MILDSLISKLQEHFQNRGYHVETSPEARVIFPAAHPEVGNIEIHDDGDELTICIGNFTHSHFSNYEENLSQEQKAERIAEDVIEFLKSLFADQIVLWGSHSSMGGWKRRRPAKKNFLSKLFVTSKKEYVWSGPLP